MPEPVIIKVGADLSELSSKLESLQTQFDEFKGVAKQSGEAVKSAFTGQAKQSTDQLTEAVRLLNQQLAHTKDPARKAELQQQIKALENETVATKQLTTEVQKQGQQQQTLRQQMRATREEMSRLMSAGKENTAEFQKLANTYGELKNKQDDIAGFGKALGSDTKYIDGAIQGVQGLVGAFSIFQGVQMLVGSENEDFQKAMLKMMATMQVLNGVQQVANILQKESALRQTLNAVATKLRTEATTENTAVTVANNAVVETSEGVMDGAGKSAAGLSGAVGGVSAAGVAAIAMLAALGYAIANYTKEQLSARYETEEWTLANDNLNTSLGITQAGLNEKISNIAKYIQQLKTQGKTQTELVEEELNGAEKLAEQKALDFEALAKQRNLEIKQAKDRRSEIEARQSNASDNSKLTLQETNELNALNNTIGEKTKQQKEYLILADRVRNDAKIMITQAREIIKNETALANERERKNKATKTKNEIDYADAINKTNTILPTVIKNTKDYETEARKLDQELINNWATFEDYTKRLRELNTELGILGKIDLSGFMKDWENQFAKQDTFFQSFVQEGDTWNRERTKQVIDGTMSMYNQLNDILLKNEAQKNDQLIKGIDDKYAKDKEKLDEDLKNKKLSQEQYDKEAIKLEEQKDKQIAKIKREQWNKEQKAAIAKATINTLVGTTQALAEGGIAGIITGALVLAAGIAEVASISSQKNPYRKGTAQILSGNSHEGGGISLGQFGTAEGGEMLGILSKKNTKRFGKPMLELFDGINKGNDSKMMKGLSGLVISAMPEIRQGNQTVNVPKQPELAKMLQIMEKPQETITIIGNKKIIKQGNYTRIVHI